VDYPVETFTDEERARLAPHVTNLDRPCADQRFDGVVVTIESSERRTREFLSA